MIIDHHGQIISKQSVAAVDNKIFARRCGLASISPRKASWKRITGCCCLILTAAFSGPWYNVRQWPS